MIENKHDNKIFLYLPIDQKKAFFLKRIPGRIEIIEEFPNFKQKIIDLLKNCL